MLEDHIRSGLKAVTWRFVASSDTFILSWLITGKVAIGFSIAGAEVFTKVLIYYLHERVWRYFSFLQSKRSK